MGLNLNSFKPKYLELEVSAVEHGHYKGKITTILTLKEPIYVRGTLNHTQKPAKISLVRLPQSIENLFDLDVDNYRVIAKDKSLMIDLDEHYKAVIVLESFYNQEINKKKKKDIKELKEASKRIEKQIAELDEEYQIIQRKLQNLQK